MTSIEELLLQDIEAVSRGVVTTEQDLRDARDDLKRRVDVSRRRDRRRVVALAAAAASVVLGVTGWQVLRDDREQSPVGPIEESTDSDQAFLSGDVPTMEQLLGVWHAHDPARRGILWKFTADGRVGLDSTGALSDDPVVVGTFDISGDAIVIEIDEDVSLCDDKSWTLRAAINENGGLNVVPVDLDVANVCSLTVPPRWVLDRLLPVPEQGDLLNPPAEDGWDPPPDRGAVSGTWYDPAAGYIVELRRNGTYTLLTGQAEKADSGTWKVADAATRLTLVSTAASVTCREGDQLVLGDLRHSGLANPVLQGDVERNACDLPFGGTGWFRLGAET
jgi:hypothetical protein